MLHLAEGQGMAAQRHRRLFVDEEMLCGPGGCVAGVVGLHLPVVRLAVLVEGYVLVGVGRHIGGVGGHRLSRCPQVEAVARGPCHFVPAQHHVAACDDAVCCGYEARHRGKVVGQDGEVKPTYQRVESAGGAQGVAQHQQSCRRRLGGGDGEVCVAVWLALAHCGAGYLVAHRLYAQHQHLHAVAAVDALQTLLIHPCRAVGLAAEHDAVALEYCHLVVGVVLGTDNQVQGVDARTGRVVVDMCLCVGTRLGVSALMPTVAAASRVVLGQVWMGAVVHRQVQCNRAVAARRGLGVVGGGVRALGQRAAVPVVAAARRHCLHRAYTLVHRQVQLIDAVALHGVAQCRRHRVAVGAALRIELSAPMVLVASVHIVGCQRAAHGGPLAAHPARVAGVAVGLDGIVAGDARVHAGEPIGSVSQHHHVVAAVGGGEGQGVPHQRVALRAVVVPVQPCTRVGHVVSRHKQRRQTTGGVHHDEGVVQHGRCVAVAVQGHHVYDALFATCHLGHLYQVCPSHGREPVDGCFVAKPVHHIGVLFVKAFRGNKEHKVLQPCCGAVPQLHIHRVEPFGQ